VLSLSPYEENANFAAESAAWNGTNAAGKNMASAGARTSDSRGQLGTTATDGTASFVDCPGCITTGTVEITEEQPGAAALSES
jgi:hypothetical protein